VIDLDIGDARALARANVGVVRGRRARATQRDRTIHGRSVAIPTGQARIEIARGDAHEKRTQ